MKVGKRLLQEQPQPPRFVNEALFAPIERPLRDFVVDVAHHLRGVGVPATEHFDIVIEVRCRWTESGQIASVAHCSVRGSRELYDIVADCETKPKPK